MFWDTYEPYHYIRNASYQGEEILIVGGYDHKTGDDDETASYQQLEHYIKTHFTIKEIIFRWSAMFFEPADGLPYIGKSPFKAHTYIATGYSGDGLLFSQVAARVLADQIQGIENPYSKLYSPSRINISASWKDFMKENLSVAKHLIVDRFKNEAEYPEEIRKGEGKIMRLEGKLTAVYRDETGHFHRLSPVCAHMKCIVSWNNAEKTWDCPCHGARYSPMGEVLEGPATQGLEQQGVFERG
ncbi:MAG: FAD-dependent oxidoreductase [Bacteroidia bacterium]|nr:FAD-dependent oxidoreductase [Bacteroidia bacterium]